MACDVAVVSASASSNGRPFIWKNRSDSTDWRQEVKFYKSKNQDAGGSVRVIAKMVTITIPSGGVNESGFAIANTLVYEDSQIKNILNSNTPLIRIALEECTTLEDFENILDHWHERPLITSRILSGNFVVIDAFGGAALYEILSINGFGHAIFYEKFDANEATDEEGNFIGFVNRTNTNQFMTNGETGDEDRLESAYNIMLDMQQNNRLNYRNMMQELAKDVCGDEEKDDCEFSTESCISRAVVNLALVVDGVATGMDARLCTLWITLGEPSIGVSTPFFAYAKKIPFYAWADTLLFNCIPVDLTHSCLLNLAIVQKELDLYSNNGFAFITSDLSINYCKLLELQKWTIPIEDYIIEKTEDFLSDMEVDPSLITKKNLFEFSHYCAKFNFLNYTHRTINYFNWEYNKPWGEEWNRDER